MKNHPWPDGRLAAISLTFDDGLASQLSEAVPLLNRFGLHGSFYVNPRADWQDALAPWVQVAADGHEVGNHSVRHMCPRGLWNQPKGPNTLEGMTLADVEQDILLAQERLTTLLEEPPATYCYPCYANHVGEGADRQSYVPVVAKHFVAARGTGEFGYNYPGACDLHYLWSWRCEGASAASMIGRAEMAAMAGTWDIFTFHGVGDGHLSVAKVDLQQFLAYLAAQSDRIWVAPVATVAKRIAAWRNRE